MAAWDLPAARSREVALEVSRRHLLVAGGLSAAHVSTATVWEVSASTGRAIRRPSLAAAVHDASGAVVGGDPLVIAGGNTTTVDDVQLLTPTGTRVIGHLPRPRSDLSATSFGGSGYVVAGFDGRLALSPVLRTRDGRSFTTVGQLRVTVRYAAVVAVRSTTGDHLLVFGGEHDGVPVDVVQDVDLGTGRTRVIGHLPQPLAHEAAFSLDGAVWLAGGRSHDVLQSRIWRWVPSMRRARPGGRLPYAVADTAVAVTGTTAYIVGGETPEPTSHVILLTAR